MGDPQVGPEDAHLLDAFIRQMEPKLSSLARWRRRRLLTELKDHLEESLRAAKDEDPEHGPQDLMASLDREGLAAEILQAEATYFTQRILTVLLSCLVLGSLNTLFMKASGRTWPHALGFGAGYGFSVGFALFWLRDRWQWGNPWIRWVSAVFIGAIAAVPWAFMLNGRFDAPMTFYGAISGFLLERFSRSMHWQFWLLDNLWITAVAMLLAGVEWRWDPRLTGLHLVPWALAYHLALQTGMALGILLRRALGQWFLERQS